MRRLYYRHPGTWFGDCMPLYADGAFQLFHQRDTRRPGPFGEPFGWALVTTQDFVTFQDRGEVLPRGGDEEQDQFIFAGSVFEEAGRFHALYTGFNRDHPGRGLPAQVLMHATSDDLEHWHKIDGELVPPQPGYDPDNWRDPYVLRDEQNDRWLMILGARLAGDRITSGRTVWFTSTDLESWDFQGDFWAPDLYSMHEMPDLFRMGDRWYLLTTEYSDRSKTVYRSSPTLAGPWSAPVDDAFDGRAYYAARSAADGDHRYLFGWVPTKEGEEDLGGWQWGGTLVVHEAYARPDGSLGVRIPDPVAAAFAAPQQLAVQSQSLHRADGAAVLELGGLSDRTTMITLRLRPAQARSFGIRLFGDPATGDGYAFTVRPDEHRIAFDRVPNQPWFRYDNRGLERPFDIRSGQEYEVKIIIDDDIATLYVDGVALNARMYDKPGDRLAVEVVDGSVEVLSCSLAVLE